LVVKTAFIGDEGGTFPTMIRTSFILASVFVAVVISACGPTGEPTNGLTPVPSTRCLWDGKTYQNGERACHDGIQKECRENSSRGADGIWAETGNKCKSGDVVN
jgi:hypothetical protein